ETQLSWHIRRREAHCLSKSSHALLHRFSCSLTEEGSELTVGFDRIGLQADRLPEGSLRFARRATGRESHAEFEVRRRIFRPEADRLPASSHCSRFLIRG